MFIKLLLKTSLSFLFVTTMAFAYEAKDFDADQFKKDQKAGKSILVDVYANWCPTCKKQGKELSKIFKNNKYKDYSVYKLDFDNKDLVSSFSKLISKPIPRQSTLVVYKGSDLKAFSVAETGEKLKEHLNKGL